MADEDVIVVSLEPDADTEQTEQARDASGKFVRVESGDPVKDIEAQFAELAEQSNADRQRAQDAERRAAAAAQDAARARQEATVAKTEIAESQYDTIVSGISEAQTAATEAEARYKTAYEAGDINALTKAQRDMARAEVRLLRLDESKADLEARRVQRTEAPQREQRTETVQRQIADPLEDLIANSSAQTGAWFRAHPEEGRAFALSCRNQGSQADNRRRAKLDAAHMDAISEGISPDTPEYFTHVESFLGIGKQQQIRQTNGDARQTTTTTRRRASVPVAPVHQSAGGTTGGGPEVRLSPVEAKAAQDGTHVWASHDLAAGRIKDKSQIGQPIGIQEFARRKHYMTKEGHYNRIYLEQ
jgi:hypothetical protein